MKKLFLLCCLTSLLLSDSLEKQDKSYFDTLSFKMGHSHSFTSHHDINGGISNVSPLDESGVVLAIRAVINKEVIYKFKPYLEFSSILYADRDFYIPSIGLQRTFESEDKSMKPYVSFGIGYASMQRSSSPVQTPQTVDEEGSSLSYTLESGLDYYISKEIALGISFRYDIYNISTIIKSPTKQTSLSDNGSLNVMLGLTYRFGESK